MIPLFWLGAKSNKTEVFTVDVPVASPMIIWAFANVVIPIMIADIIFFMLFYFSDKGESFNDN
ncbi:hypothetical protein GCM10022217_27300 [Chryseobacterium ginsenosidimutans]